MRMFSALSFVVLAACGGSSAQQPTTPTPTPEPVAAAEPAPVVTPEVPSAPAPAAEPVEPPKPAEPGDPLEVGASFYKKVFEDDKVRVLEVTFQPGDKIPAHKHPDHVAYVLAGGKLKIAANDAAAQELDLKTGDAVLLKAQSHTGENTGTTEVKAVIVELKIAGGTAAPAGKDPLKAGGKMYKLLLDDPRVRVLEVTFKAGQKIAKHTHPDHAVYVVEGGKLKISPEGAEAQEMDLPAGAAVTIPAGQHSAVNTGKTKVRAIVFELKPAA